MTETEPRGQTRNSTPGALFISRFKSNRLAMLGLAITVALAFVALAAPLIAPSDPYQINTDNPLEPPSLEHPFGTDELGRDLLSRMIYGARISLAVGFVAVGIATLIGALLGATAGFFGGRIDELIMRFTDLALTIPTIFLILAVIALLEPSIFNIMAVIGLTGWMGVARLTRAETLSLKERDFVLAAVALGASRATVIFKHILPNAAAPILVSATLGIAGAILTESALSFLGLGVQPPTPSWGQILTEGKANIEYAWWVSLFPGLAILIAVLGYNLLGEGIRDALDPKTDTANRA